MNKCCDLQLPNDNLNGQFSTKKYTRCEAESVFNHVIKRLTSLCIFYT